MPFSKQNQLLENGSLAQKLFQEGSISSGFLTKAEKIDSLARPAFEEFV